MKKRIIAFLLAAVLLLGLMPTALAAYRREAEALLRGFPKTAGT